MLPSATQAWSQHDLMLLDCAKIWQSFGKCLRICSPFSSMPPVKVCDNSQTDQWKTSLIGISCGLWQSTLLFLLTEGHGHVGHGPSCAVWLVL
jgi:hypothetical protein